MNIGQWMLVRVPSSETQVNTSDKSQCVVNDNELLVMRLVMVINCCGGMEDTILTQYSVISAAFSKMLWSGWRRTLMFPWPGVPSGQRLRSACLVWAELQVNA